MTRTVVPDDWNRGQERWSANWFAQARSVCKAHARFRNAGYKRKVQDKKKVRTMTSALWAPDQRGAGRPTGVWEVARVSRETNHLLPACPASHHAHFRYRTTHSLFCAVACSSLATNIIIIRQMSATPPVYPG